MEGVMILINQSAVEAVIINSSLGINSENNNKAIPALIATSIKLIMGIDDININEIETGINNSK